MPLWEARRGAWGRLGGPLSGSAVLAGPFLQPRVTACPVMNYGGFAIMPQFRKYFS